MSAADPAPIRTAPLDLWRVAEAFLGIIHALFGGPERIAFQHTLTSKAHGALASWLRCGEALMRRLLLIEAAAYPKPNTRPLLTPARRRVRKLIGFSADAPEHWRVSFRAFAQPRRVAPPVFRPGPRKAPVRVSREDRWAIEEPVTFRSAWPLAERYQALIRVVNDPGAYAHRLSRRLHATPHRIVETLRAPPEAAHRVEGFDDLTCEARTAWRPYFSSG